MEGRNRPGKIYTILVFGMVCISTGAVFTRLAEAPPLTIAAYRLGIAGLILVPVAIFRSKEEIISLTIKDWALAIFAGILLAMHFYTWIFSLSMTTVSASVVLVTTSPIWAAIAAPFLGERVKPFTLTGILFSFCGATVIGWGDIAVGGGALRGDLFALTGAVFMAAYLFAGKVLRRKLSLLVYTAVCYGSAGVVLWIFVLAAHVPFTGFSPFTWTMFLSMAAIPQIMGHSSYNWALKYLGTPMVAVSLLGEPVGSSILAWLILSEKPGLSTVAGGSLILCGIVLAAWGERKRD